jgi:hypothetical protein
MCHLHKPLKYYIGYKLNKCNIQGGGGGGGGVKNLALGVFCDAEALCNWPISTGRKSAAARWVQTQLDELKHRWAKQQMLGKYSHF